MDNTDSHNVLFEVLAIDLKQYMMDKNFQPITEQRNLVYFKSPFLALGEQGPNDFIVDKLRNTWTCQSIQRQGNVIDLDALLHNSSIPEALQRLKNSELVKQKFPDTPQVGIPAEAMRMTVLSVKAKIRNESIVNYLKDQHLSVFMARKFFQEVTFLQSGSLHTGLGTTTSLEEPYIHVPHLGAYYLQSNHRFYDLKSDKLSVFTSAMDMLHNVKMTERSGAMNNMLLLTDVYAFENARPIMERHTQINLYLPKNPVSEQYLGYAAWLSPNYKDFSASYGQHESLSKARIANYSAANAPRKKHNNKPHKP